MKCPDGGRCHHECAAKCWRVRTCAPLSASGWEDWPPEVKEAHRDASPRLEDLLLAGEQAQGDPC